MSEYAVTDPATAEVVATYPTATDDEIEAAIAAAAKTGRSWAKTSTVAERAALIGKVADLHEQRREQLADVIVREMGKPRDQALGEVDFCAAIYRYYAENAEKFLADEQVTLLDGEGSAVIKRGPVGVLLGIMPWNYPYYQVARFAGPRFCSSTHRSARNRPSCCSCCSTRPASRRAPTSTSGPPTTRWPRSSPIRGSRRFRLPDPSVPGRRSPRSPGAI